MSGAGASCLVALLLLPGDWPLSRHDAQNTAAAVLDVPLSRPLRGWTYGLRRQIYGYEPAMAVWSPPAPGRVGDRPVVAAGACDHNVYLFDAESGELLWRHATGGGVYSAPLLWKDSERVVVLATSSDRTVYALDAKSGQRLWSQAVTEYRPTLGGSRLSSPALGEVAGKPALFVGHWVYDKSLTHHLEAGGLSALDARSGRLLWRADFLDQRVSAPVFYRVEGRGMVFAASEDGNLRALDSESGSLIWSHRQTQPIMGSPLLFESPAGARVIIGGHFGRVRCLDARGGEEVWNFATGNWVTAPALFYSHRGRPLVAFGSYDRHFYALDAESGRRVWTQGVAGPVYSAPALIDEGPEPQLVFAAWDNQLYGLSGADGTLLWTVFCGRPLWDGLALGDSPWGSPAAVRLGESWMVFFGSWDGVFYAMPLSQLKRSSGRQPWTNFGFLLGLGLSLAGTAALSLALTRRRRKHRGRVIP